MYPCTPTLAPPSLAIPAQMLSPAFRESLATLSMGLRDLDTRHRRFTPVERGWRLSTTPALADLLATKVPGRLALLLGAEDALLYSAIPGQGVAAVALGWREGDHVTLSGTLFWGSTDAQGTLHGDPTVFDALAHLEGLTGRPDTPFWDIPQLPSFLHAPAWAGTRDALVQAFLAWADLHHPEEGVILRAKIPRLHPLTGRYTFHTPFLFVEAVGTTPVLASLPDDPQAAAFCKEAEAALLACGLTPLDLAASSAYTSNNARLVARSDEHAPASAHARLERRVFWERLRAGQLPPPAPGAARRTAPHHLG